MVFTFHNSNIYSCFLGSRNPTEGINFLYMLSRDIELRLLYSKSRCTIYFTMDFIYLLLFKYKCLYSKSNTKKVSHVVNEKMFSYPICCILFGMSLIPLNVSQIKFIEDTLYKFTIIGFVFIFCLVVLFLANIKFKLKKGKLKA